MSTWTGRSPLKRSSSKCCRATRGCAPRSTGERNALVTPSDDPLRGDPRFLALVHDSCKAEVPPHPQWSPDHDHPTLVRRFAERYAVDERLLSTLELHDEPFWLWRHDAAPEQALRLLLEQLPNPGLFARFVVELDAADEGKDLTFLRRFRRELAIAGRLPHQFRDRNQ
jgi:hypothetical protein